MAEVVPFAVDEAAAAETPIPWAYSLGPVTVIMYTTQGAAMVGTDLIVLLPDGRAAALTFSCHASQADEGGSLASAIFDSVSSGN